MTTATPPASPRVASGSCDNRRKFERLELPPMYTGVSVELPNGLLLEGHAYDLSEGGVQFELDEPVAPGTPVVIRLELPSSFGGEGQPATATVSVTGNIVWNDTSEPGPARLAAAFTRFATPADRNRLLIRLASVGRTRRAA